MVKQRVQTSNHLEKLQHKESSSSLKKALEKEIQAFKIKEQNAIDAIKTDDLIGLKEGDEIISINFKKIDDYALDEIASIFKAKNSYSVVLEIWRGKSSFIKLLKLKKRI